MLRGGRATAGDLADPGCRGAGVARRTARSRSPTTATRRSRCPTRSRPSTLRYRSREDHSTTTSPHLRNYGSLFLGRAGDRRLRRQGHRHQPRAADDGAQPATPAGSGSASSSRPAPTSALTEEGTRRIAPTIAAICEAEQFARPRPHGHDAPRSADRGGQRVTEPQTP